METVSERRREVGDLIRQGLGNKQIARRLRISEQTVKNHVLTLFAIANIDNRVTLAVRWPELCQADDEAQKQRAAEAAENAAAALRCPECGGTKTRTAMYCMACSQRLRSASVHARQACARCIDCGGPVKTWTAQRCRTCYKRAMGRASIK